MKHTIVSTLPANASLFSDKREAVANLSPDCLAACWRIKRGADKDKFGLLAYSNPPINDKAQPTLSLVQGIAIQAEQLERWRAVLNEGAFNALCHRASIENDRLAPDANGFDVWRGTSMDTFIANHALAMLRNPISAAMVAAIQGGATHAILPDNVTHGELSAAWEACLVSHVHTVKGIAVFPYGTETPSDIAP